MDEVSSESLDNIRRILEEGRFQEAIDECRALLFEDPTHYEVLALLRQANEALEGGTAADAAPTTRPSGKAAARKAEPQDDDGSLQARLAREIGEAGDDEGDEAAAPSALPEGDQERVDALVSEGEAAFAEGKYQQALDVWSRIYIIDLNNHKAQKLIEKARTALEEDQRRWDEMLQEANDHLERREYDEAVAQFERILEASPNHAEARDGIERVEQARRQEGQKAEKIKQLMAKAGKIYKEGNVSEAVYNWEKVLEMEPGNERARQLLTDARRQLGEPVTGADRFTEMAPPPRAKKAAAAAPASPLISSVAYAEEEPPPLPNPPGWESARSPVPKFIAIAGVAAIIVAGAIYVLMTRASGVDDGEDVSDVAGIEAPAPDATPSAPVEDVVPAPLDAATFTVLDKELASRPPYVEARKAFNEGRFREAATFYEALQSEVPDSPLLRQQAHRSHHNAGVVALRAGDLSGAGEEFSAAIAIEPEDSVVRRHLATVERFKGKAMDDRLRWYAQLATLRK